MSLLAVVRDQRRRHLFLAWLIGLSISITHRTSCTIVVGDNYCI